MPVHFVTRAPLPAPGVTFGTYTVRNVTSRGAARSRVTKCTPAGLAASPPSAVEVRA
jgi:hypothetical protein